MRAGQGGMPAEIYFDLRCKPAEAEILFLAEQERCLRQVHLPSDILHPRRFARGGQYQNGRRIAREGPVGKRVDLDKALTHGFTSLVRELRWRLSQPVPEILWCRRPPDNGIPQRFGWWRSARLV